MKALSLDLKKARARTYPQKQFDYDYADLSYADLSNTDLSNCSLRFANLIGANLQNAKVDNACFEKAIFDSQTRLPFSLGEAFDRKMIFKITTAGGEDLFYKAGPYPIKNLV